MVSWQRVSNVWICESVTLSVNIKIALDIEVWDIFKGAFEAAINDDMNSKSNAFDGFSTRYTKKWKMGKNASNNLQMHFLMHDALLFGVGRCS